jgi:hypothetical protein
MSATRPSREPTARASNVTPARDVGQVRERRRRARRKQRLARLDLGLGVLGAIVLLLATPGLAISALVALLVLAVCLVSFVLERRKRVRARTSGPAPRSRTAVGEQRRPRAGTRRDRPRSTR